MNLKPWREIAEPHEDVRKGTFQQSEFAADLSRVHEGTATPEYQNPTLFFQRTFITEGMRLLLDSVVKRLAGKGGDPVIQLQTAFGGGKTHTMLAVYHLAKGDAPASELPGVSSILDSAAVTDLPRARIAVLDGVNLLSLANKPRTHVGCTVKTIWGELAWQLAGEAGVALVQEADQSGTAPGKKELTELLASCAPCVILIDELVRYLSQFEEGKALSGGTYDTQLSFIQSLTEALKAVPNAVLLASLPFSDREAGSQQGVKALRALEHYFGRVQALWKPVATEEAFEIVRRRLFANISDKLAAESVCRNFADFYTANRDEFPQETQESRYFERMIHAYPIHPEVFDRLYEDWSSLDNFQRTRGVLKLMAKVIHRLWSDNDKDPLIMPGNFPFADADTRNEVIYYLPPGWDPVVEGDIDGDRAETTAIENKDTRFGAIQACRRTARTIFLGSAPSTSGQMVRGIELERITLGVVQPGQQIGVYKDALRRLSDRLHYLNNGNNRFWFDTRPNLRREMEDRKRRFHDTEDVFPAIQARLQQSFAKSFFRVHVFSESHEVSDDWELRLVVLRPDAAFSKTGHSLALEEANKVLKNRGEQPRFKQNRLIFLAADFDSISRLKDQVRSTLAWQSIASDIKDMKLNLDQFQTKQAHKSLDDAKEALQRMIRETYKWLLAPVQHVQPGKGISDVEWEYFPVNPSTQNFSQEIERVLKENELVITEWAPIHLATVLKNWFWKEEVKDTNALNVWQQSCHQLYLPRLRDDVVFHQAMQAGAESKDFFGYAQGKENGRYLGFCYGKRTSLIMDGSLLLIEPVTAANYLQEQIAAQDAIQATASVTSYQRKPFTDLGEAGSAAEIKDSSANREPTAQASAQLANKTQFYANVDLDSIQAKKQFSDIVEEVIQQFTLRPGVKVKIAIEIQAESALGFDEALQRTIKENCGVLKFKNAEFED